MTKNQELEILDAAISKLGPDTYLGPWLSQIRFELKSLLQSDILPQISLEDASKEARLVLERANLEADRIVKTARKNVQGIEQNAAEEATRIGNSVLRVLRDAEKALSR